MQNSQVLSQKNPASNYLLTLYTGPSRLTQRSALDNAARIMCPGSTAQSFNWSKITREMVLQLRSTLLERQAPSTANRTLSAVKQVCREAWRMRILDADELQRICDVKRVPGTRLKAGRCVDVLELQALLDYAHTQPKRRAVRDVALLHMLFFGGMRRHELAGLGIEHVRIECDRVIVRVIGKGNRQREIPMPLSSTPALRAWLRIVEGDGALFPNKWGGFMKPENVHYILINLARRAKLPHTTPHDGRRTFISYLLDADADVAAIQALAGHINVQTTLSYDRRPEQGKKKAVDKLPKI
ncbi:MAG: hypothetical protein E6Q97_20475 [Desulfurellales bacterium]|nr:MAG: hypothetical protein E6Q97_20475 [Desulfurellales bacterium]